MKKARERANALWDALPPSDKVAIDLNYLREARGLTGLRAWKRDVEAMFKEHARDQRHACAEAVCALADEYSDSVVNTHTLANRAHALVMNTPAPGDNP